MKNIQGLDYKLRANYFVIVIFFVIVVLPAPDGEDSTILKPKTIPFLIY